MPHTRRLFPLAAACLMLPLAAQAGATLERIKAEGRIVLAHRESSVPFSYLDASGKPVGYAMDLCRRVAEAVRVKLGRAELKVVPLLVTPASRIAAITEGKADLECGSTTNNAERRQAVAFTVPHYVTGARYLVRADSKVAELRDFEGKKLVSTAGTTPLRAVQRANTQGALRINVTEAADHARAVDMVAAGEADGFAMDEVLLYGLVAGRPDAARFKVVGKYLTIEPLAIMLPKGDAAFKKIVDDEMRRLIYSREAHALHDRWLLQPIPPRSNAPATALNIPLNYLTRDFWKFPTDSVPN
jgi:ABC-type amino acid transport substrate-binding protein